MKGQCGIFYELRNVYNCEKKRSVESLGKSNTLVIVVEDGVVDTHEDISKNAWNTLLIHDLDSKQALL